MNLHHVKLIRVTNPNSEKKVSFRRRTVVLFCCLIGKIFAFAQSNGNLIGPGCDHSTNLPRTTLASLPPSTQYCSRWEPLNTLQDQQPGIFTEEFEEGKFFAASFLKRDFFYSGQKRKVFLIWGIVYALKDTQIVRAFAMSVTKFGEEMVGIWLYTVAVFYPPFWTYIFRTRSYC
jgi:hypothetical protein